MVYEWIDNVMVVVLFLFLFLYKHIEQELLKENNKTIDIVELNVNTKEKQNIIGKIKIKTLQNLYHFLS